MPVQKLDARLFEEILRRLAGSVEHSAKKYIFAPQNWATRGGVL